MATPMYELYMNQKGKKVTDSFITDVLAIMLEADPDLKHYVQELEITDDASRFFATYDPLDKKITFFKNNLEATRKKQLATLHILRNQVEHARNIKTFHEGIKDIETTVVDIGLKDYAENTGIRRGLMLDKNQLLSYRIAREENRSLNPTDRLAEIRSMKYIVNLLKNQRDSEDLILARRLLFRAYLQGYKSDRYHITAPTYEFMLKTGLLREFYWLKNRV